VSLVGCPFGPIAVEKGWEYDRTAKLREVVSTGTVHHLPPRGHYLAHEAGRLAGVSGNTIGQWAGRGYIRSSQSEESPRVYSYQDVAEAMIVHELRDRGIDYAVIRETIENLREQTGNAWPLSRAQDRLATAHGTVVVSDAPGFVDLGRFAWHGVAVTEDDVIWRRRCRDRRRGDMVVGRARPRRGSVTFGRATARQSTPTSITE